MIIKPLASRATRRAGRAGAAPQSRLRAPRRALRSGHHAMASFNNWSISWYLLATRTRYHVAGSDAKCWADARVKQTGTCDTTSMHKILDDSVTVPLRTHLLVARPVRWQLEWGPRKGPPRLPIRYWMRRGQSWKQLSFLPIPLQGSFGGGGANPAERSNLSAVPYRKDASPKKLSDPRYRQTRPQSGPLGSQMWKARVGSRLPHGAAHDTDGIVADDAGLIKGRAGGAVRRLRRAAPVRIPRADSWWGDHSATRRGHVRSKHSSQAGRRAARCQGATLLEPRDGLLDIGGEHVMGGSPAVQHWLRWRRRKCRRCHHGSRRRHGQIGRASCRERV